MKPALKLEATFEADTLDQIGRLMIQAALQVLDDAAAGDTLGGLCMAGNLGANQRYSFQWGEVSVEDAREQGDPPQAAPGPEADQAVRTQT